MKWSDEALNEAVKVTMDFEERTMAFPWQPVKNFCSSGGQYSLRPDFMSNPPQCWDQSDVHRWLNWCRQEYAMPEVDFSKFSMNGKALCMLTKSDFCERVPGLGDVLYNTLHFLLQHQQEGPGCSSHCRSIVYRTLGDHTTAPSSGHIDVSSVSPPTGQISVPPCDSTKPVTLTLPVPYNTIHDSNQSNFVSAHSVVVHVNPTLHKPRLRHILPKTKPELSNKNSTPPIKLSSSSSNTTTNSTPPLISSSALLPITTPTLILSSTPSTIPVTTPPQTSSILSTTFDTSPRRTPSSLTYITTTPPLQSTADPSSTDTMLFFQSSSTPPTSTNTTSPLITSLPSSSSSSSPSSSSSSSSSSLTTILHPSTPVLYSHVSHSSSSLLSPSSFTVSPQSTTPVISSDFHNPLQQSPAHSHTTTDLSRPHTVIIESSYPLNVQKTGLETGASTHLKYTPPADITHTTNSMHTQLTSLTHGSIPCQECPSNTPITVSYTPQAMSLLQSYASLHKPTKSSYVSSLLNEGRFCQTNTQSVQDQPLDLSKSSCISIPTPPPSEDLSTGDSVVTPSSNQYLKDPVNGSNNYYTPEHDLNRGTLQEWETIPSHYPGITPDPSKLLWEFIDHLLVASPHPQAVCWEDESQLMFRVANPNLLAKLWGIQKRKNGMTYEKLSRALRYYYKMGIMTKVRGKRLTYKFLQPPSKIQKGQRGAKRGVPHKPRNMKFKQKPLSSKSSHSPPVVTDSNSSEDQKETGMPSEETEIVNAMELSTDDQDSNSSDKIGEQSYIESSGTSSLASQSPHLARQLTSKVSFANHKMAALSDCQHGHQVAQLFAEVPTTFRFMQETQENHFQTPETDKNMNECTESYVQNEIPQENLIKNEKQEQKDDSEQKSLPKEDTCDKPSNLFSK